MTLIEWAKRHNISQEALRELTTVGLEDATESTRDLSSEAGVASALRLSASQAGVPLWRNNVGAFQTPEGRWVRYGLANDSATLNAKIKSSDLIGIKPVLIKQEHVGTTIGQFVARETKSPGWSLRAGDKRAQAQLKFLDIINRLGGDGKFNATGKFD